VSEISPFKAFYRLPLQSVTNQFIVAKIEPQKARGALKVNKVFCLFEQSGTFKNEFIKLGIPAEDFEKVKCGRGAVSMMRKAIIHGTPLPDGVEILTKEAYSDLCTRAADVPNTNVGELDNNPIDIDKAIEHYEGTLEMLKGVGLEVDG